MISAFPTLLRCKSAVLSVCLTAIFLSGCETIPYADERTTVPSPVVVADASPERLALNTRVYDTSIRWVTQRFYKRDFGGIDWPGEAAARREAAVAQPTEADFYRALNETLDLLGDAHTSALSPTRNRDVTAEVLKPQPSLGLTMAIIDGQFIVTFVHPDGPAFEVGVQKGWRVESVDGQIARRGLKLESKPHHELVFTDAFDATHAVVIVERDLPPEFGQVERRADGVLVLAFDYFGQATEDWFEAQMRGAIADPPAGIIVDLRSNKGGLLKSAGRTLAPFFATSQPFAYVEMGYLPRFPYRTRRWRRSYNGPVAVVVGDGSYSASEIFAATMQETGRGVVVGVKTPGFVVAARSIDLPDGGELSIGVRSFQTGGGRILEGVGVTPDIEVMPQVADFRAGRDTMIEAAAARLLSGPAVSP